MPLRVCIYSAPTFQRSNVPSMSAGARAALRRRHTVDVSGRAGLADAHPRYSPVSTDRLFRFAHQLVAAPCVSV